MTGVAWWQAWVASRGVRVICGLVKSGKIQRAPKNDWNYLLPVLKQIVMIQITIPKQPVTLSERRWNRLVATLFVVLDELGGFLSTCLQDEINVSTSYRHFCDHPSENLTQEHRYTRHYYHVSLSKTGIINDHSISFVIHIFFAFIFC